MAIKKTISLIVMLLCVFASSPAQESNIQESNKYIGTAQTFIENLNNGKYKEAHGMFASQVAGKMDINGLEQVWMTIELQFGAWQNFVLSEVKKSNEYNVVTIRSTFENSDLNILVTVDNDEKIAGFFFQPVQNQKPWDIPKYADSTKFTEIDIIVGSGEWELKGKLTLPKTENKVPGIVLVHGSGPHDMDETIGPNKIFKDIAWGLASQGIAVLRYDKRSLVHPSKMMGIKDLTMNDIVTDDAVEAIETLAAYQQIDNDKIYVLGHSLGGMMLPRISQRKADVLNGGILLAANARPLDQLYYEQINYLSNLDNYLDSAEAAEIDAIAQKRDELKNLKENMNDPTDPLLLNLPASCWIDLMNYSQTDVLARQNIHILIAQGKRDYQVTMTDLELWKNALKGKDVEYLIFDDLNHLFMSGEGRSVPGEYEKRGHVDENLIIGIAKWIKQK